MFTKEQISKRTSEISLELEAIEKKGINITSEEEKRFDDLIAEFNLITNTINGLEGRREKVHYTTFAEVKDALNTPVNMAGLRLPIGIDSNGNELRFFTKENLPELRSYIGSKGKLGISNYEELSFGKFARGIITGDWKNAPNEFRALGTATDGGGWLVPEEISNQVITLALAKAQVMNAGAVVFPMDAKTVVIPKILTMPQTEWKAENAAFSKSMDMTFEGIMLEAKTIMAVLSLSIELAADGINVESTIQEAITQAIALEIDKACLVGAGGLEPTGIVNTSDILTEVTAGITSYNPFSNAFYKVEAENGTVNALIAPSSVYAGLDLLKDKNNQPLNPPVSWSKYKQFSSNQLTNQSVMGNFTHLLIGTRQTINLEVSRVAVEAFKRLQVLVRAYARIDVAVRYPKHFCVISEISS